MGYLKERMTRIHDDKSQQIAKEDCCGIMSLVLSDSGFNVSLNWIKDPMPVLEYFRKRDPDIIKDINQLSEDIIKFLDTKYIDPTSPANGETLSLMAEDTTKLIGQWVKEKPIRQSFVDEMQSFILVTNTQS